MTYFKKQAETQRKVKLIFILSIYDWVISCIPGFLIIFFFVLYIFIDIIQSMSHDKSNFSITIIAWIYLFMATIT